MRYAAPSQFGKLFLQLIGSVNFIGGSNGSYQQRIFLASPFCTSKFTLNFRGRILSCRNYRLCGNCLPQTTFVTALSTNVESIEEISTCGTRPHIVSDFPVTPDLFAQVCNQIGLQFGVHVWILLHRLPRCCAAAISSSPAILRFEACFLIFERAEYSCLGSLAWKNLFHLWATNRSLHLNPFGPPLRSSRSEVS